MRNDNRRQPPYGDDDFDPHDEFERDFRLGGRDVRQGRPSWHGNDRPEAQDYSRGSGRWGAEEPDYGRPYGERPNRATGGQPNRRGPQYEQGGPYPGTRRAQWNEPITSRSADPGQSSYGGFRDEDPRWQRQQFHDGPLAGDYGGYHGDGGEWAGLAGAGHRAGSRRILPKGYTRSDERLREDVCERLAHSGLDVSDVSVSVTDGQVELSGTVARRRDKYAIENCADDCLGVADIDNRIRVVAPTTAP